MEDGILLEMRGINKSFPGVIALRGVDLTLRRGEIHALMGENGAGKSTLIKVLTGVYPKDSGCIFIHGHKDAVQIRSPQEAQTLGISTVYQEIPLCPNLTAAENIYLGRGKGRFVSRRKMREKAGDLLSSLGIDAEPDTQLADCSIAVQQMIAIARAVDMNASVLILDEPTSSLDDSETEKLFGLMRKLKERGTGMIFVTHFLDQVYEICDRITVLRDGALVGEYPVSSLPKIELVSAMLGRELEDMSELSGSQPTAEDADIVYQAEGLCSSAGIEPVDLSIRRGEVIGFAGLLGSGRSECVRAVFGADKVTSGNVSMNGKSVKITCPIEAMKHGIAYLPEDRKNAGIIGELSVRDNIILALQAVNGFFHPFTRAQAESFAEEYIKLLDIKTPSPDTPVNALSGGNQQKVILGRWLLTKPELLILDEPTRGIDVGTKTDIQKLIVKLASGGMSVAFISSETDEMLRTCSRLLVMRDRRLAGELTGNQLTQSAIMNTIAGGDGNEER